MKLFFILVAGLMFSACSNENLPDSVDANLTPAAQEEREEEVFNSPDVIDENIVPAHEEEREREEERINDDIQLYE